MKNQKRGFISIKIILIVVGVLIVGGLYFLGAKNTPLTEEVKTAEETPENPETADWKTYRNKEYGFELRYPEDFNYYEEYDGVKGPMPTVFYKDNNKDVISFIAYFDGSRLEEKILKIPLREIVEKGEFEHSESYEVKTILPLNEGFFVSVEYHRRGGNVRTRYGGVFENIKPTSVMQSGKEYNDITQIYISFEPEFTEDIDLVKQILSTLKFID